LVAAALLAPWLIFLTARQTALYPPSPTPATELVSLPVAVAVVMLSAAVLWLARPGPLVHAVLLTVLTGGIALVGAQLGSPLANATADYCADFCRSAIFGRFLTFFGWPLAAALGVAALALREARAPSAVASLSRVAWSRAFAVVTLVLGYVASIAWWGIVLPTGGLGPPGPY
jgi:hypothetical protein